MNEVIGAIGGVVLVVLAIVAFVRGTPVPPPAAGEESFAGLGRRYRSINRLDNTVLIWLSTAGSYAWWRLFLLLGDATAPNIPNARFMLAGLDIGWAIPAFAAGVLSFGPVSEFLNRRLLGDDFSGYATYKTAKHMQRYPQVYRRATVVGAALVCLVLALLADWYSYATDTELVDSRLFGFTEQRLPWTELEEIRTASALVAPNGDWVFRREYVLLFSGDRKWSTSFKAFAKDSVAQKSAWIHFAAERSGVAVTEMQVLTQDDLS